MTMSLPLKCGQEGHWASGMCLSCIDIHKQHSNNFQHVQIHRVALTPTRGSSLEEHLEIVVVQATHVSSAANQGTIVMVCSSTRRCSSMIPSSIVSKHFFLACPNPNGGSGQRTKSSGGGGGDNACFKCGESGHYSNGAFL